MCRVGNWWPTNVGGKLHGVLDFMFSVTSKHVSRGFGHSVISCSDNSSKWPVSMEGNLLWNNITVDLAGPSALFLLSLPSPCSPHIGLHNRNPAVWCSALGLPCLCTCIFPDVGHYNGKAKLGFLGFATIQFYPHPCFTRISSTILWLFGWSSLYTSSWIV